MLVLSFFGMMGGSQGGGAIEQMVPLLLIGVVFYFFMIRPQMKKSKDQKKYREAMSKGDKVVTVGGVHGKILEMDETTVVLEMIDKTRIKVEKSAISMESSMALAKSEGK